MLGATTDNHMGQDKVWDDISAIQSLVSLACILVLSHKIYIFDPTSTVSFLIKFIFWIISWQNSNRDGICFCHWHQCSWLHPTAVHPGQLWHHSSLISQDVCIPSQKFQGWGIDGIPWTSRTWRASFISTRSHHPQQGTIFLGTLLLWTFSSKETSLPLVTTKGLSCHPLYHHNSSFCGPPDPSVQRAAPKIGE